jgi:predicted RecA/RadA family phage recombinase
MPSLFSESLLSGISTTAAITSEISSSVYSRDDMLIVSLSDESTPLVAGTTVLSFRSPFAMTLTSIPVGQLGTASTSGVVTVDINESGTTILGNKLTIDQDEKTSTTAATAATLTDTSIAADAEITFDIDTAGTGAKSLKVILFFKRT